MIRSLSRLFVLQERRCYSSSSSEWHSALSRAAELTSYPRVPEKLRQLLLEDADLVNWQERMGEVERGKHPLGLQVRRLFRDDRDALQVASDNKKN